MAHKIKRPYSSEERVAEVQAMIDLGFRPRTAAVEAGISEDTVYSWLASNVLTTTHLEAVGSDQRSRIAVRSADILEDMLDATANGDIKPSPVQVATVWGIAVDKQLRARELVRPGTNIGVFLLVQGQRPDAIEAQAIDGQAHLLPSTTTVKGQAIPSTTTARPVDTAEGYTGVQRPKTGRRESKKGP